MSGKGITMDFLDRMGWEAVEKLNALLDMEEDQQIARRAMMQEQSKEKK